MEGAASVALYDDHTSSAGLLRVQDLDSIRRAFVRRGGSSHDSNDLATNFVRVPKRKLRILHTSAYVSIRQHTSASVSIRQHISDDLATNLIRVPTRKLRILHTLRILRGRQIKKKEKAEAAQYAHTAELPHTDAPTPDQKKKSPPYILFFHPYFFVHLRTRQDQQCRDVSDVGVHVACH